ncbi:MAG TPA: hypothetical protein VH279_07310 [Solirubrobacteraceae bacterium]|jgi:uncharacterized coiled-coil protein SlyX|nr:hypothetical protein [Solirubrobacteraceae bacterium]
MAEKDGARLAALERRLAELELRLAIVARALAQLRDVLVKRAE